MHGEACPTCDITILDPGAALALPKFRVRDSCSQSQPTTQKAQDYPTGPSTPPTWGDAIHLREILEAYA